MVTQTYFDQRVNKHGPTHAGCIGPCWLWTGTRFSNGYGAVKWGGRMFKAHRVSWELHRGRIPPGICVCHRCDTPACANPNHLFLGTNADNMADMKRKGRAARGMRSGLARISDADVRRIRDLCRRGRCSQAAIGRAFGVSQQTVSAIVLRERWAHVD